MSEQGVDKKPREFYFEYMEETNEYQQLSNNAPYVRDHSFELVHVVEYSRVEQLEKEKEQILAEVREIADWIEAQNFPIAPFNSLRQLYLRYSKLGGRGNG